MTHAIVSDLSIVPPARATRARPVPREPDAAARRLAGERGAVEALRLADRELRLARRARSRVRYGFWMQVRDHLLESLRVKTITSIG
jgi:hypothetical protein